jgi:DNA invertase Pin-like site-specific DNA recombinase
MSDAERFAAEHGYGARITAALVAFEAWQGQQRAEKIRAGLAARKARGGKVGGRAPGQGAADNHGREPERGRAAPETRRRYRRKLMTFCDTVTSGLRGSLPAQALTGTCFLR